MSNGLLVFLVAVGVVAFFIFAFSLTQLIKGHQLESDIGDNRHMKERGIKCAAQQLREEEVAAERPGKLPGCGDKTCGSCLDATCQSSDR